MKLVTFICVLFLVLSVNAQTQYPRGLPSPSSNGYIKEGYTQIDSGIITNVRDTFLAKYPTLIKWSGNNKYYYTNGNGTAWYPLVSSNGIGSLNAGWGLIKVNDSTLRVDSSINGVATWALLKKKTDSLGAAKLNVSDTASMLSKYVPLYLRTAPTSININNKYFNIYGQNSISDYTSGRLEITGDIGAFGYQKYGVFYGLLIDTLGAGSYYSHTSKPINYVSDYSANFTSNSLVTKSYVDNAIATISSGTYTPTIGLTSNASASTARVCQYMRVGSVVTVSGYVSVTSTSTGTSTRITMTLPVSSTFSGSGNAGGSGGIPGAGASLSSAVIFSNTSASTVSMDFVPYATGSSDIWFTFTYKII